MSNSNNLKEKFLHTRGEVINNILISYKELEKLRKKISKAMSETDFCDGCGFCCIESVSMTRLECERIIKLVDDNPSLLKQQGFICPFLNMNQVELNRNLKIYGKSRESFSSFNCRIYDERPIICRLFPDPKAKRCREFSMLKVPDPTKILSEPEYEQFPQLLIQKYFITMRWEWLNFPDNVFDETLKYQIVPGWVIKHDENKLQSMSGPDWLSTFDTIPEFYPVPDSCGLEDWELGIMDDFLVPVSYETILQKYSSKISPENLGALLGHLEIANIIVPIDIGNRMYEQTRGFWNWHRIIKKVNE